jgi:hypothetical protein
MRRSMTGIFGFSLLVKLRNQFPCSRQVFELKLIAGRFGFVVRLELDRAEINSPLMGLLVDARGETIKATRVVEENRKKVLGRDTCNHQM